MTKSLKIKFKAGTKEMRVYKLMEEYQVQDIAN
jgi:hypothetical protein